MRRSVPPLLALPLLALPLLAASPEPKPLRLSVPVHRGYDLSASGFPRASASRPAFIPAPLPNREIYAPVIVNDDTSTSVSPTLFNRRDQFRGDGLLKGSSSQVDQERRVVPGAGFNIKMPFAPK